MNYKKLKLLLSAAQEDLKQNGFIGMDYNMAVICIIARKLNIKLNFKSGGSNYDTKIEYWASKRTFAHLRVSSEDKLIEHALKEYKIS